MSGQITDNKMPVSVAVMLGSVSELQEELRREGEDAQASPDDLEKLYARLRSMTEVRDFIRIMAIRYKVDEGDAEHGLWETFRSLFRAPRDGRRRFLFDASDENAYLLAYLKLGAERRILYALRRETNLKAKEIDLNHENKSEARSVDGFNNVSVMEDPADLQWLAREEFVRLCNRLKALALEDKWTCPEISFFEAWIQTLTWDLTTEDDFRSAGFERTLNIDPGDSDPAAVAAISAALGKQFLPEKKQKAIVKTYRERLRYRIKKWVHAGKLDDILDPDLRRRLTGAGSIQTRSTVPVTSDAPEEL